MRIVWQGGPTQGLGSPLISPEVGAEYDVDEAMALSLIEQGKARPAEKPEEKRAAVPFPKRVNRTPLVTEEEE